VKSGYETVEIHGKLQRDGSILLNESMPFMKKKESEEMNKLFFIILIISVGLVVCVLSYQIRVNMTSDDRTFPGKKGKGLVGGRTTDLGPRNRKEEKLFRKIIEVIDSKESMQERSGLKVEKESEEKDGIETGKEFD